MEEGIVLTKEGYQQVLEELEHLKSVHRREVADRIREAKQFGEFLENSEYEEAKSEQAFVEGRILDLKRILQHAIVVEGPHSNGSEVEIGSMVLVRDIESGEEVEYKIVGPVEADPARHRISNQSPVGQAVLGRKVGESVQVQTPGGTTAYLIEKIS